MVAVAEPAVSSREASARAAKALKLYRMLEAHGMTGDARLMQPEQHQTMTITNTGRIAYQVGDQVRLNKPYQGHVLAQVTEVLDQNPNWVLISVAPFTIERRGRVATFRVTACDEVPALRGRVEEAGD
jgi:hypothetical protein